MTVWLPLQRSFLALCRFICQICEFCQLPRPGILAGSEGAALAWGRRLVRMPGRDTEIIKFMRQL